MQAKPPLRVLVADADAPFAEQIRSALQHQSGMLVDSASTGDEAIELARSEEPDVAFVALDMPGGFEAAESILQLLPKPPRVILLTADDWAGKTAAGVSGYVRKTPDVSEIAGLLAGLASLTAVTI